MLSSLIHAEIGSSSQSRLLAYEAARLIQSLFGSHHLTSSLMEAALGRSNLPKSWKSMLGYVTLGGDCFNAFAEPQAFRNDGKN